MMLVRAVAAAFAAMVVHEAVGEPDCADFDPRVPLSEKWPAGLSTSTSHRGLQEGCSSMLSASTIAEFDNLIAQNTVM